MAGTLSVQLESSIFEKKYYSYHNVGEPQQRTFKTLMWDLAGNVATDQKQT